MPLIGGMGVQLKRHEHVGRRPEVPEIEAGCEDADHDMRIAAQRNRFPDDLRIGRIAPVPKAMAEHDDFLAVRQILLLGEGAATDGSRAEQAEIIRAYLSGLELLRK